MRYLSVCSGVEAASLAWHGLGWSPVAFSEIDPGACRVLAHRFGSNLPGEAHATNGVPNWGDMTRFEEWPDADVDVIVGGTPCQDYSVAGKRLGMAGSRGSLSLTYIQIAARYRPDWIVWENVPGVLSSQGGRDFARFLGDLSGQSIEVPPDGWKNAGLIPGIGDAYGLAYRVLDAQFARACDHPRAVPQRRRRVIVVGYLGDWRRAAAVLFDAESLRGDPPPRREAGQRSAPTLAARTHGGGGLGTDFDLDGGLVANSGDVGYCLTASAQQSLDAETETLIAVAHALRGEGFDASEDGTGRGTPLVPVAFDCKGGQVQTEAGGIAPTLRSMGHGASHQNGGGQLAIAIQERAVCENPASGPDGAGIRQDGAAYTLDARTTAQAVAFDMRGRDGGAMPEGPHDTASIRAAAGGSSRSYIAQPWAVRRLTPRECERLMGFPDDWTLVPGKHGKPAADGPRYKQCGNSMAVNVMAWIGERIALVQGML
ncbi:DNA cytosine methyltransferase [Paracoccus sp. p3-h83]|uniref:DNA cytosine methyltransferase n=1 Tax=Paracoccus sp. p3-h83 TaxID=3342805 RepID=UPI0035B93CC6